ncbi:MAG: hypothetical protein ACE5EQ_09665 [Phycisphaerae bacterium]
MSDAHDPNQPPAPIPVDMPAPPSPEVEPETLTYAGFSSSSIGIWRQGKLLVMRKGLRLPTERCVICGEQAVGRPLKRHLSWHHPAIYLTILVGLLIYVIVALIVRKTAVVYVGLCPVHRKRRRWVIVVCWLMVLATVPIIWLSVELDEPGLVVLAALSFIAGLVVFLAGARVVTPYRIDDHNVWIRGVGPAYLDALPLYPGP